MPVYTLNIPADAAAMRLDKFIRVSLPQLPEWAVREAFSNRDVKLDGKRVKPDDPIAPGGQVKVYVKAMPQALQVVYEDSLVLLIHKRPGISVAADKDDGPGVTVLQLATEYLAAKGEAPPLLCHRLDNQTSGLMLLAKTHEAEQAVREAFAHHRMEKQYTCLVKGTPVRHQATLNAYLVKDPQRARVRIVSHPGPGALEIVTGYQVVEPGQISRLKVDLVTGRTHQIRAHLASIGHPILGDDAYGDRAFNRQHKARQLKLCAARLTFHTDGCLSYLDGRTFEIQAPF